MKIAVTAALVSCSTAFVCPSAQLGPIESSAMNALKMIAGGGAGKGNVGVKRTDMALKVSAMGAPAAVAVATEEKKEKTMLRKNIKTPDPIPEAGIEAAVALMRTGRLYRYNSDSAESCAVSEVEKVFAEYTGHKYCTALNSCGSAIFLALRACGVEAGDKVLSNAFTFGAVPSAIVHAGGEPIYVDCLEGYVLDPEDLARRADESGAKYCVVSHMRGKLADMDRIKAVCDERGITLIEDCAHSLGVRWKGDHSGHHGKMACFSSQSYKMLNSGEGGFIVSNDDQLAADAIIMAGGYEKLYTKHLLAPPGECFEDKRHLPNYSLRMHAVTAAMLTPQMDTLDDRIAKYNARYECVAKRLEASRHITIPKQLPEVSPVCDSLQFVLTDMDIPQVNKFAEACGDRGLPVEIFGAPSNARFFRNWLFHEDSHKQFDSLGQTQRLIEYSADIRLPLMFEDDDFETICIIVEEALEEAISRA